MTVTEPNGSGMFFSMPTPPRYIKPQPPLSYKVLRTPSKYKTKKVSQEDQNFFRTCIKHHSLIYNPRIKYRNMKKNRQENLTTIGIDPITGEYHITIPEWICDEKGWYEGTELNVEVENDCIIIRDLS